MLSYRNLKGNSHRASQCTRYGEFVTSAAWAPDQASTLIALKRWWMSCRPRDAVQFNMRVEGVYRHREAGSALVVQPPSGEVVSFLLNRPLARIFFE